MKRNNKGKTNDLFRTPDFIFNQLNNIYKFDLDVACTSLDKKCTNGICFDLGQNALQMDWRGNIFCNPPFSMKSEFILKAINEVESRRANIVVMLLPLNSISNKIYHEKVFGKYEYEVLKGRISFLDLENKPVKYNDTGTIIIYFKNKIIVREE